MKDQKTIQISNQFDEMALSVGLGQWSEDGKKLLYVRYPGETNKQLRDRAREAGEYTSNSTKQGLINNLSRDLLLERYNCYDKTIFHLTQDPWTDPTGVHVYVSGVSTSNLWQEWLPQVRASGYTDNTSGWILWNLPDTTTDHETQWGQYTRILEFIGTSLPTSGDAVRIRYPVKTGEDDLGRPIIATFEDFDNPSILLEDKMFQGEDDHAPSGVADYLSWVSGRICVYSLEDLGKTPASSQYYTSEGVATDRLKELKRIVEDEYPTSWGRFKWDTMRWDALDDMSDGVLPSLHDSATKSPDTPPPNESGWYLGGVRYGPDLYCDGTEIVGSGSSQKWYPKLYPGEFYIGTSSFYLFEKENSAYVTLGYAGEGLYSGTFSTSTGPQRMEPLSVQVSGYGGAYLPDDKTGSSLGEVSGIVEMFAYVNDTSGEIYRQIPDMSGKTPHYNSNTYASGFFTYDYDNGILQGSGLGPDVQLFWEDPNASGAARVVSGVNLDICPLANDEDRIYFIRR